VQGVAGAGTPAQERPGHEGRGGIVGETAPLREAGGLARALRPGGAADQQAVHHAASRCSRAGGACLSGYLASAA